MLAKPCDCHTVDKKLVTEFLYIHQIKCSTARWPVWFNWRPVWLIGILFSSTPVHKHFGVTSQTSLYKWGEPPKLRKYPVQIH